MEYKIGDRVEIYTLMFRDSLPEDPTGEIVDINTDSPEEPLYQVKVDGYFDQPGKTNTGVLNMSSNGFMYTDDTWPLYASEIRLRTTFHLNY